MSSASARRRIGRDERAAGVPASAFRPPAPQRLRRAAAWLEEVRAAHGAVRSDLEAVLAAIRAADPDALESARERLESSMHRLGVLDAARAELGLGSRSDLDGLEAAEGDGGAEVRAARTAARAAAEEARGLADAAHSAGRAVAAHLAGLGRRLAFDVSPHGLYDAGGSIEPEASPARLDLVR